MMVTDNYIINDDVKTIELEGGTGQTHEKIKIAYSNNSVYDTVKEKQRSLV